jgi:hypothetical protein
MECWELRELGSCTQHVLIGYETLLHALCCCSLPGEEVVPSAAGALQWARPGRHSDGL